MSARPRRQLTIAIAIAALGLVSWSVFSVHAPTHTALRRHVREIERSGGVALLTATGHATLDALPADWSPTPAARDLSVTVQASAIFAGLLALAWWCTQRRAGWFAARTVLAAVPRGPPTFASR